MKIKHALIAATGVLITLAACTSKPNYKRNIECQIAFDGMKPPITFVSGQIQDHFIDVYFESTLKGGNGTYVTFRDCYLAGSLYGNKVGDTIQKNQP